MTGSTYERLKRLLTSRFQDVYVEQRFISELTLAFGAFVLVAILAFTALELTSGTKALAAINVLSLVPILAILAWLQRGGDPSHRATALVIVITLVDLAQQLLRPSFHIRHKNTIIFCEKTGGLKPSHGLSRATERCKLLRAIASKRC